MKKWKWERKRENEKPKWNIIHISETENESIEKPMYCHIDMI